MFSFVVFDTETSALNPSYADVLSFGALKFSVSEDLKIQDMKLIHKFFAVDREVPKDASAINGLTRSLLQKLSGGDYIEDCIEELSEFIYDSEAIGAGYNTSFDIRMLKSNLTRQGLEPPKFKETWDVMQRQRSLLSGTSCANKPRIKLAKAVDLILVRKYGMTMKKLEEVYLSLINNMPNKEQSMGFHTALYDAYLTMCILLKTL